METKNSLLHHWHLPAYLISWLGPLHSKHNLHISKIHKQNILWSNVNREKQSSSVQFSRSVRSDSLWPHELQHCRPPCRSPTPRVYSHSCALSRWYHPTISSSVIPFSSCLPSFPASGSFQMSQFFTSGGQSIGASASTSVLPMNIQDWLPLGLTGLIL